MWRPLQDGQTPRPLQLATGRAGHPWPRPAGQPMGTPRVPMAAEPGSAGPPRRIPCGTSCRPRGRSRSRGAGTRDSCGVGDCLRELTARRGGPHGTRRGLRPLRAREGCGARRAPDGGRPKYGARRARLIGGRHSRERQGSQGRRRPGWSESPQSLGSSGANRSSPSLQVERIAPPPLRRRCSPGLQKRLKNRPSTKNRVGCDGVARNLRWRFSTEIPVERIPSFRCPASPVS